MMLMFLIKSYSIIGIIDSLRLDAITRSPINSMFSTSLNGLTTIRAYNKKRFFLKKFLDLVDTNGRAFFTY